MWWSSSMCIDQVTHIEWSCGMSMLVLMMLNLIRVVVQVDKDNHQFMCVFERLMEKRCS
jgi:hypothetical protein